MIADGIKLRLSTVAQQLLTKLIMEPTSLTAAAIATLVITKAFEKTGEKLGEKVLDQSGKLMALIRRKAPETAASIEKVADNPALAEQQPTDFGEATLIGEVEQLAANDPEMRAEIETLARQASPQVPLTIENWKGINIKGGVNTVSGNRMDFH